jgi:hypothetical protein
MADRIFANRPASNTDVRLGDVPLVEEAEGTFAQLMALFAAWRADIDSEPFAYSDEELLRAWVPPNAGTRRLRVLRSPLVEGPEPPASSNPHWT